MASKRAKPEGEEDSSKPLSKKAKIDPKNEAEPAGQAKKRGHKKRRKKAWTAIVKQVSSFISFFESVMV